MRRERRERENGQREYDAPTKTWCFWHSLFDVAVVVGGLDICYGRWDTRDHVIVDNCHLSLKWPGKDYINPNKKSLDKPELPFREHIDRYLHSSLLIIAMDHRFFSPIFPLAPFLCANI